MSDIGKEIVKILEQQDQPTLASWWSELNHSEWPNDIPEPNVHSDDYTWALMCWIKDKIGLKECLRDWNKDTMPGKKFDRWYDTRHLPLQ